MTGRSRVALPTTGRSTLLHPSRKAPWNKGSWLFRGLVNRPVPRPPQQQWRTSYDNPLIPGSGHYLVPEYNLSSGMNDLCVTSWQRQINRRYGQVLTVDGIFGPRTRDWTTRIQGSQQ